MITVRFKVGDEVVVDKYEFKQGFVITNQGRRVISYPGEIILQVEDSPPAFVKPEDKEVSVPKKKFSDL